MNKSEAVLTVIIPTLNEEICLPKLLGDLSKQTFRDFSVVIVDAESQDKTKKRAYRFRNHFNNFSFITSHKKNISYQRNLGAKNTKSQWLIFMDADNRLPTYFLQGIKFWIELYTPDILSTWIEPDTKNASDKAISILSNLYIDLQKATDKPPILESLLCIKNISFKKLKGFDENIIWSEGSDLLSKAKKKKMKFILVKHPRYQYSFRRFKKQGNLQSFRSFAELELNRLRNKKISKNKTKILYPLEGGEYFLIDDSNQSKVKKFVSLIMGTPNNKIDVNKEGNTQNIFSKIKKFLT